MKEVKYTKTVVMVKGESKIVAHVSRGSFIKYSGDRKIVVDGEFGRSGDRCGNDWHGDYADMKDSFIHYVGERVIDGYQVKSIEVSCN